jgi:hypothetical protein
MADNVSSDVTNTAKKFARTPKMLKLAQVRKVPAQHTRRDAFKKLQRFAHAKRRRHFHEQVHMVGHNLKLIHAHTVLKSNHPQHAITYAPEMLTPENRHSILRLPHQMVRILTNRMRTTNQTALHFHQPSTPQKRRVHTNTDGCVSAPAPPRALTKQNMLEKTNGGKEYNSR